MTTNGEFRRMSELSSDEQAKQRAELEKYNNEIDQKNIESKKRNLEFEEKIKNQDNFLRSLAEEKTLMPPESFMSKFVRPIIEVITKYIMENYLTEENITTVSNLMQSIVEEFFKRLDDIKRENPRLKASINKLTSTILNSISKEARRTVVPEGDMAGGKRRRHTKKRRTGKRRY
jgi:uncharacterized membrane-anchored protein YjiN (DUF445 family)